MQAARAQCAAVREGGFEKVIAPCEGVFTAPRRPNTDIGRLIAAGEITDHAPFRVALHAPPALVSELPQT